MASKPCAKVPHQCATFSSGLERFQVDACPRNSLNALRLIPAAIITLAAVCRAWCSPIGSSSASTQAVSSLNSERALGQVDVLPAKPHLTAS